jgi:hypothetical protein
VAVLAALPEHAARSLVELAPPTIELLPEALRLLEDPDERVRQNAAGPWPTWPPVRRGMCSRSCSC